MLQEVHECGTGGVVEGEKRRDTRGGDGTNNTR